MVVKVLINTSVKKLNKVFDYGVPAELEQKVVLGKRVSINFGVGLSKVNEGIIVKVISSDEYLESQIKNTKKYKLKNIIDVLDEISYIDEKRLKLAKWMSQIYFCNVYDTLKLMMPPGTNSINSSKNINTNLVTLVVLKKSIEQIEEDIESKKITSAKHVQLLRFLSQNEYVLLDDIVNGLGISKAVIKRVVENGYVSLEKTDVKEEEITVSIDNSKSPALTEEQQIAVESLRENIDSDKYSSSLLFGVTGSGKTEVYLNAIEHVINKGKTAIVLVPEISLTHQTLTRFVSRFGDCIGVLHSKMTISKRKEEYRKIMEGKYSIVLGARSAIFAPLKNIGLIVIDEEHDSSYYSQTTPKYSTKEVAKYIAKESAAVLLLGSATPEVSTYYKAKTGKIELLELTKRPNNYTLPQVITVDLKEDRILQGKSILSVRLKEEILKNIQNKEKTMIFLNKRGYTSSIKCNECGHIVKCPNCDVPLTYHKSNKLLVCHYCSHVEQLKEECLKCKSTDIHDLRVGTEKLEEELTSLFHGVKIIRMDADTTIKRDSYQKILDDFKNKDIDILVGTQMISKGHDISDVTLVGVLGADTLISMNDYMSSERAYSNISQVSGRAGRGEKKGRVIIETSDSENHILEAVKKHDYIDFYEKEIEHRKLFIYPPFIDFVLIELSSKDRNMLKNDSEKLYEILNDTRYEKIYKVFTPKSPFVERVNNKYKINIVLKCKFNLEFLQIFYAKLKEYDRIIKKDIRISITKNPIYIG